MDKIMIKHMILTLYNQDGTTAGIQFIPEEEFSTENLEEQLKERIHKITPEEYCGGICTVVKGWGLNITKKDE